MAGEGGGDYGAGFLAGGDEGVAGWNPRQQGGDVGGCDHFQEGVRGIVPQPPYFAGGVIERQAGIGTELSDRGLVEPLLGRDAEMLLVPEVNQPHDPPEVVDPVGVIERHAPAVRLGRETAQEQDASAIRQEGFKWMLFGFHVLQR